MRCPIDKTTKIKILLPDYVLVGIIKLCLTVRHVDKIKFDIDIPDYHWRDRMDTVRKLVHIGLFPQSFYPSNLSNTHNQTIHGNHCVRLGPDLESSNCKYIMILNSVDVG